MFSLLVQDPPGHTGSRSEYGPDNGPSTVGAAPPLRQEIEPTGQDPTRLDEYMRPLGLVPGEWPPLYGVLSLVENAFGIRLTHPGEVDNPRMSGWLSPLPE